MASLLSKAQRFVPSPALTTGLKLTAQAVTALIFFKKLKAGGYKRHDPNVPDLPSQFTNIPSLDFEVKHRAPKGRTEIANNPNQRVKPYKGKALEDCVYLLDIDSKGLHETIVLPFIPRELEYNTESSFVAIKPMGANNPRYQYTGSEDKLEFEIDWYAFDNSRRSVIENCRKLESLSKGDGYTGAPHRVMLVWGKNHLLFNDHIFIVLSAPYKLTNFNKYSADEKTGLPVYTNMLPIQAYQKVTLARVTEKNLPKVKVSYVADPQIYS